MEEDAIAARTFQPLWLAVSVGRAASPQRSGRMPIADAGAKSRQHRQCDCRSDGDEPGRAPRLSACLPMMSPAA